jgi:hypothetical protein
MSQGVDRLASRLMASADDPDDDGYGADPDDDTDSEQPSGRRKPKGSSTGTSFQALVVMRDDGVIEIRPTKGAS